MRRPVAIIWHASFLILAGLLYFFFALPRFNELSGAWSHTLGTTMRVVCGLVIALSALPVLFTRQRTARPEYGTPELALSLRTWSIVLHIVAGVLIIGAAISEIWLTLDQSGTWLFGIYGAAAGLALLAALAFYLAFVAELPPPPPAPLKVKAGNRRKVDEAEVTEVTEATEVTETVTADEDDEAPAAAESDDKSDEAEDDAPRGEAEDGNAQDAESDNAAEKSGEETADSTEDEAEVTAKDDAPAGKLRNRRSGKGSGLFGRGA
ncbi:hypothetical protein FZI85_10640 [Mycobacterium sp. CBMA293]|uniref:hypothetical protein n=1 Tax=unclassified Mycolicibacterium TaxID=2636767 RepID=UPI0012DC707D|nr:MULTISPECIES: hypothetical protein [unclassified Mycolicibacterium]MUL46703.1 hypothetical protein [Mycolicibacterium sp. CBMA 360]MUL58996.1 hypothetical protein [Mycolicibacterium sp. CBMA 335]MUL69390.1 hypothetical protein [Mycolicibacterium sp. CBMA 311]MUL94354.1 hypothetical protein [Mycolicibacterium sp. CBMA 230]MUM06630.1 hypothetical protein [Mycolicibacterium sp. CBMA 213]